MIVGTTGVGSLPGADLRDAVTMPFAEGLEIPYLAETPARGAGADMIGRAAARLIDMPVEIQPSAWRLTRRAGIDLQRAHDFWSWDLDALERAADGYRGTLKVALAGPWTLAASVELPNGHRVLTDPGAVRDLHDSLAEGTVVLADALRRRVPGADVVVQFDEPSLRALLDGQVPTASGFGRLDAVGTHEAGQALQRVIERVGGDVLVHTCAPRPPFGLLRTAGAAGVLFDAALLGRESYDELGEAVDAGLAIFVGAVPAAQRPTAARVDEWARRAREVASIAGIGSDAVRERLGITTDCGLAGSSWQGALAATRALAAVAKQVRDNPEVSE